MKINLLHFLLISCFVINGFTLAKANITIAQHSSTSVNHDSTLIINQVKERQIAYLLGVSGNGTYRQNAVGEIDEWVEAFLAKKEEPLIWEDSIELVMNDKIKDFSLKIQRLAIAFRSEGSKFKDNQEVKRRIISGLKSVLKLYNPSSPRPGNWYPWHISLPNNLGSTALLMESDLPKELLLWLRITLRDELTDRLVLTGANAAWESRNHIYLALLDNDIDRLERAADYVFRTVRYGTDIGVLEDYSYLFHGRIPYAGGYGAGFAQTITEFIYVFDGTPYAISPIHLDVVINLLLEHTRWFVFNGQVDLHVRGRSFKEYGAWNSILQAVLVLSQTNNSRRKEFGELAITMLKAEPEIDLSLTSASFADRVTPIEGQFPVGFRYWPTGEIGAYNQPNFHVGFRQYSKRVQDYEYLNRLDGGKGEEGWNLAYGFTNILRKDGAGSWFSKSENAMITKIDLEHLPGTTSRIGGNPVNPKFEPNSKKGTMSTKGFSLNYGKSSFAGGAGWENGGVAGFILKPAYGDFIAKKSLHFFPEGFWALGSEIKSTANSLEMSKKPIHTTILQWPCEKSNPQLFLDSGASSLVEDSITVLENLSWFWLGDENVSVVFQKPTTISVRLNDNIVTAWIDHGVQPTGASYAYAMLPDASLKETRTFAYDLPFRPVQNDDKVHAVKKVDEESVGIVFFEADSCLGLEAKSPVIVYKNEGADGGVFSMQDPLHLTEKIELSTGKLTGTVTYPNKEVDVMKNGEGITNIEISPIRGRIYRFGYGKYGKSVYSEPRINLSASSYSDFRVEASSDSEKTILTVYLPDEALQDEYKLSVHFSKSQRLYDFTKADIIDYPSPDVVRYQWNRTAKVDGSAVFSDYWMVKEGRFLVYLVTQLTEQIVSFVVPETK